MIVLIFMISTLADQIAAYVGDHVILESTVNENISYLLSNPATQKMFPDTSELREYVINELISQKLVVIEAEKESIYVADDEVRAIVEQRIEGIIETYPSEADFLKDLESQNISVEELRQYIGENVRAQLMMNRLVEKKSDRNIMVSPIAVKRFYEDNKDSIALRPARVKLSHILMFIKPSEAEQRKGFERALDVYKLLHTGGDFAVIAQEFSDDASTKYKGGMLGKVKKGEGLEEFEAIIFNLKPGVISQPIPTRLGYHIVEVLNKSSDWVLARHILIKVRVTKSDTLRYEKLAERLRELINKGTDFDSLAEKYSDDPNIDAGEWFVDQLAPPYNEVVKDLEQGQLSEPIPTPLGYHLLYIKEKIPEATVPFEELREQIFNYLMQQELQDYYIQLVDDLKKKTFVKVFPKQ